MRTVVYETTTVQNTGSGNRGISFPNPPIDPLSSRTWIIGGRGYRGRSEVISSANDRLPVNTCNVARGAAGEVKVVYTRARLLYIYIIATAAIKLFFIIFVAVV